MRHVPTILALLALAAGCTRNATWLPNADGNLNKPAKHFIDDAATRFPYPADLPRGGEARARAEIGYQANVINFGQYSGAELADVELWVNRSYVLFLPKVEVGKAKFLPFKLFYNDRGQHLPESGVYVDKVEMKLDGTMYDVPHQLGG
jgi:hypothetical protein